MACWSGFDFCSLSPPLAHLVRVRVRVRVLGLAMKWILSRW